MCIRKLHHVVKEETLLEVIVDRHLSGRQLIEILWLPANT